MWYLALQSKFKINGVKVINLLSAINQWRNTLRVYHLQLHYWAEGTVSH